MTPTGAIAAALIIAALAFAGHAATRVAMRLGWKPAPLPWEVSPGGRNDRVRLLREGAGGVSAATLRKAAAIVRERGLAKGLYADNNGRVCAEGALCVAVGGPPRPARPTRRTPGPYPAPPPTEREEAPE